MKILFFIFLIWTYSSSSVCATTSPELAAESCQKLQKYISDNASLKVSSSVVKVPRFYGHSSDEGSIDLFVWGRPGTNPEYPPLVFFHGGTGGNSNLVFELPNMISLLQDYPGGFYSLDLRGESCSKPKDLRSDLHPHSYKAFSLKQTAKDIEFLRIHGYFGKNTQKIRIFGQSRGAALVHHYFSRFPRSVESAHAHGFSVESIGRGQRGVITRANGMLVAWKNYLRKYPEDAGLALKIKTQIPADKCWTGIDETRICGPESLGILGILLARVSSYDTIHKVLQDMTDGNGNPNQENIFRIIGERWLTTSYREFNYVMGTNGYNLASLGFNGAEFLRRSKNRAYFEAPFSEVRFINEAIVKSYRDQSGHIAKLPVTATMERYSTISYAPIRKALKTGSSHFFLYGSQYDGIAPLKMYRTANHALSGLHNFKFKILPNGHEDFENEAVITTLMKQSY